VSLVENNIPQGDMSNLSYSRVFMSSSSGMIEKIDEILDKAKDSSKSDQKKSSFEFIIAIALKLIRRAD